MDLLYVLQLNALTQREFCSFLCLNVDWIYRNIRIVKCLKNRVQELCESRGGHPGLSVPRSPYGLCGRKATVD